MERESLTVTRAPLSRRNIAAARPLLPRPTTNTRLFFSSMGLELPRSFSVVSANSEKISARIQKRAITLLTIQPSSSKWWCSGAILKMRLPPRSL